MRGMGTGVDWRIWLFRVRVIVACLTLLAIVLAIILTPSFPNIILLLLAASLWSLISLFLIYVSTNPRKRYEHWILHSSFDLSNSVCNLLACVIVLLFVSVPALKETIPPKPISKALIWISCAICAVASVLWTISAVDMIVKGRGEDLAQQTRARDIESRSRPGRSLTHKSSQTPSNTNSELSSTEVASKEFRQSVSEKSRRGPGMK